MRRRKPPKVRRSWGFKPVSRVVESKKIYRRPRVKRALQRSLEEQRGKEQAWPS